MIGWKLFWKSTKEDEFLVKERKKERKNVKSNESKCNKERKKERKSNRLKERKLEGKFFFNRKGKRVKIKERESTWKRKK